VVEQRKAEEAGGYEDLEGTGEFGETELERGRFLCIWK